MFSTPKILITTCVALVLLASACGVNMPRSEQKAPPGAMRDIEDDLGRRVKIPVEVERVVSLAPNLTENIYAVGAGDRLVGVTTFCNYPAAANDVAKVGDTINPNIEAILALKPQIVFVTTASQIETFTKTLEQQGVTVYVTNPRSLDDVLTNLRQLGEIFDTPGQTATLLNELNERILAVDEEVAGRTKTRTFVQISKSPLFTIGAESFLTALVERAGGESVTKSAATKAFVSISNETALALRPDVIVLSDSEDNREPNDVFKNSPAVLKKRVVRIDADTLSRPSPRLVNALEQLAEALQQQND